MKTPIRQRLLSVAVALTMLLSLLPAAVFAADEGGAQEPVAISAALAGDVGTGFTVKGVVTMVDGKNVYVQDDTGGICLFMSDKNHGFALGDTVIGTGTKKLYNGLPELDGVQTAASVKVTDESQKLTLASKQTTIGALTDADICTYISIGGLTVTAVSGTTYTLQDAAGATIALFKPTLGDKTLKVGSTLDFTGALGIYNTIQLRNTKADELTIAAPSEQPGEEPVEEPEEPAEAAELGKLAEAPVAGTQLVIYHPASKTVLGTEPSGAKLAGVAAEPAEGKLTLGEGMAYLTVGVEDGVYTFTCDGKYLTSAAGGNGVSFADELSDCGKWTLEAKDGAWFVKSVGANYNGSYNQALEYYRGFTTYGVKDTDPYWFEFYGVVPNRDEVSGLYSGQAVAIFNPANNVALTATASGTKLKGADATLKDGKLLGDGVAELTVVITDDGYVMFTLDGKYLTSGATGNSLTFADAESELACWQVVSDGSGAYFLKNKAAVYNGNAQYFEYYNTFTVYGKKDTAAPEPYAVTFPQLGKAADADTLLSEGERVVIYCPAAEGSFGADDTALGTSLAAVPTEIFDGAAYPRNGAYVFTVGVDGTYFVFKADGKYLATNNDEALYMQEELDDSCWWYVKANGEGWTLYNKSANYKGTPVCIEYFSSHFSGWTFKAAEPDIFRFTFLPLAEDCDTLGDLVNNPRVVFTGEDSVTKQAVYEGSFTLDDLTPAEQIASVVLTCNGSPVAASKVEGKDKDYVFTIPASVTTEAEVLDFAVDVTYLDGETGYIGSINIAVYDVPLFVSVTPASNSETGENKRPEIAAEVLNVDSGATVEMSVNGAKVAATLAGGRISYQPSEPMADGRTAVNLTVTRADGASASKAWSFFVGVATEQLYFGQLHSHTTYSDGSGSLKDALKYISELPKSDNIQFVAFTDHSNYFDSTSAANPEDALYDMSVATEDSQRIWKEYKDTAAAFNAEQGEVIALAGFEMTWSGGPGHINTWVTPGIVSRNNKTLNDKTADAGMKAYYKLLSREEGVDSISQFNHPGKTFGNFSDFSYWDAVVDSRIYTVEVGNGEGAIGAGGYYPSYEQYTMALDKGWHVAPTNNQDNHKGRWGNANDARDVILTDDFTEEGLYAAMRAMKVYATEDKNLELYYTVNGLPLGSQIIDVPETLELKVQVSDPDKHDSIAKVEVIVNSGKVAYTWDDAAQLADGMLSAELAPDYSYYYIRVTETDGDLAVTAPVWVGETLKLGVSAFDCGTAMPVTNEELTLTTTLFNSEKEAATLKSVVYTTNGSQVLYADTTGGTVPAGGTTELTFNYTPTLGKVMTITVTVVMEQDGKEYTYAKDVTLDVQDADNLVYVGIDAAHYNEYVAGNYKDSMGNFAGLAAGYGVRVVYLNTSEELIAACENSDGKYVALIFTAPSRRLAASHTDPRSYSEAELAAIAAFNKAGGAVVVAGWSDSYENASNSQSFVNRPDALHMSAAQNRLLAALGSSLRIADDATYDDSLNGGQAWRLYFSTYNMDNPLMNGVTVDPEHPNDRAYSEVFSHYGGASVYAVNADGAPVSALPATVSPAVYGHASTYSVDADADGLGGESIPRYAVADGDARLLITASEQLDGQGLILVSGAAFMSNFEVQAEASSGSSDADTQKNYSNYKFCENLVGSLHEPVVTPIAVVQAQEEEGFKYTIEGVVTSNASGYDKDTAFFDCIYVQDENGDGICCFPVAGSFKIGDKVRISGYTDFFQGEAELQVQSISKLGDGTPAEPKAVTAAQINDRSVQGALVSLSGTVVSFAEENGLVQTILVKDAAGDVARVFIDGYITTENEVENLEVGCNVTATGLASYDDTFDGIFPRIRIRSRADIVCTEGDTSDVKLELTPVSGAKVGTVAIQLDVIPKNDLGAAIIALTYGSNLKLVAVEGVAWTEGDTNLVVNEDIPSGGKKTILLTFEGVAFGDLSVSAQVRAAAGMDETEYGVSQLYSARGFLLGDANEDGRVSAGDLVRLRNYIGMNGENLSIGMGGDLNADGAYNGMDLTALHRYFATLAK